MAPGSTSRSTNDEDAGVIVGVVRGAHGLAGEVRVEPLSDASELRFQKGATLLCRGVGELTITAIRGTPEGRIVRFRGYDDRAAAETLRNRDLLVTIDEARRVAGEGYLWRDLIGMSVTSPAGVSLGEVVDVLRAGETDVLVVRDGERETLLPTIASVIRSIDRDARRIVAQPQEEA
ncbi:MAG: 16S rRNA processing protein RimM [Chloroflexi bacterium]|nr:16S rRNA processing protein RimM [Chloroflexota bacterium]